MSHPAGRAPPGSNPDSGPRGRTPLSQECFARGIPVLWLSSGGWLQGFAVGQPSKYVELRRQQTAAH
ncbi:MAG: CRISPR-associated endonuclease Cas1, partial [Actinobacteria bacterium]|nr:CRISPR-associated endonuclease Cas1 [Actinomycetota bacterium]